MKLKEYQVEHSKSIFKSLMNHKLAIDLSPLGSGKTYTAIGIATLKCFECVIIVCPKSVIPKWTQLSIENNIQHKAMIMTPCKFTKQSFEFELNYLKPHQFSCFLNQKKHYQLKFFAYSLLILNCNFQFVVLDQNYYL